MKGNKILLIFSLCIIILNLILIIQNRKLKNNIVNINKFTTSLTHKNKILKNSFIDFIQLQDSVKENFEIRSFNGQRNILLFRFSELYCRDCYLYIFDLLKEVFEDSLYNKIYIIADYSNKRNFNVFKKRYNLNKFNIINYYPDNLDQELDSRKSPYFFLLTNGKQKKFVFFPNRNEKEITKKYLLLIKKKYFQ